MLMFLALACSTAPERVPVQAYDCWTDGGQPEVVCGDVADGPAGTATLMAKAREGAWQCRESETGYCEHVDR